MVLANLYGDAFILVSTAAALWSLWWIVRGSLSNDGERQAEVDARQRVADGGSWEAGGTAPAPFTDAELHELSDALEPLSLEEAGVEARRRPEEPRRLPWSNNRP